MDNGITRVVGVDVGDDWTHLCAVDLETGEVLDEGKVKTHRRALEGRFRCLPRSRVAMEVGGHSRWMSALLRSLGHEVVVANARKLRFIWQGTNKHDRLDARKLAKVARMDPYLLHPVRHRGPKAQGELSVIRARDQLVRVRTRLISMMRSMVKATGERLPRCSTECFAGRVETLLPESLREALEPVRTLVAALTASIKGYDALLETLARTDYPEVRALKAVPGVGSLTCLAMVLVLEDPGRFRKSREVGPALGLVPRRDQSGEVDRQLGITKTGDGLLRRLLVQCAQHILRSNSPDSDLKRWGLSIAARGGKRAKRRAVVAVARKLAVLLHRLWVSQEPYRPLRKTVA